MLAKILYSELFNNIIIRMNNQTHEDKAFIGILDIPGLGKYDSNQFNYFDIFRSVLIQWIFRSIQTESKNSSNNFDQLSINYTNEKFQQFFVQCKLENEERLYVGEKIDVSLVPYFNNIEIIGKSWTSDLNNSKILCYMCLDSIIHRFLR